MNRKGEISSINTVAQTARVTFRGYENTVTAEIPYAVGLTLNIGDRVMVAFFSDNLADGVIIASIRR
ncbi:hypothetical protein [Ferviditalea candida]|uniref:Uncharacterized protein n=1 Tax=Ferviditalea candida TaxID=3108399 RepID=A0ABU5ZKP7_9BACL|nr:hypothetical protein [Paenibacillaceae bacterium T2]